MASLLGQALGAASQTQYQSAGLGDTGISGFDYKPVNIEKEQPQNSTLHQIFDAFLNNGAAMVKGYDQYQQNSAQSDYDAKQTQLVNKDITKQEYDTWVNNGDMFWKDNPYATAIARQDLARNYRKMADDEVLSNKEKYKSLADLHTALAEARRGKIAALQKDHGISSDDKDMQIGFGDGMEESNIHISEAWNQMDSDNKKNVAKIDAYTNINSVIHDKNGYDDPVGKSQTILTTLQGYSDSGVFSSVGEKVKALQDVVAELGKQPNGATTLERMRDQTITIGDKQLKVEDLVGSDIIQGNIHSATSATTDQDAKLHGEMMNAIADIQAEPDPSKQDKMLHDYHTKYDSFIYPNGDMSATNEWTQKDEQLRAQIKQNAAEWNAKKAKESQEGNKTAVGNATAKAYIQAEGDIIPDNWSWDTKTAGERGQAYTNGMNDEVARIQSTYANDPQRVNEELMKLAARDRGGFMQRFIAAGMKTGRDEWSELKRTGGDGKQLADSPQLKSAVELYRTNPSLYRQMVSDDKNAATMEPVIELLANGEDISTIAKGSAAYEAMDDQQKRLVDIKWGEYQANPTSALMSAPQSVKNNARQIFNISFANQGDVGVAQDAADDYIDKHTTSFGETTTTKNFLVPHQNRVSNAVLNIDGNEQNIPRVASMVQDIIDTKHGGDENCIVEETPDGSIRLTDVRTGQGETWTRSALRKEFKDRSQKTTEQLAQEREKALGELATKPEWQKNQDTLQQQLTSESVNFPGEISATPPALKKLGVK